MRELNKRQKWNIIEFTTILHHYTGAIQRQHTQCTILGYHPKAVVLNDQYPKVIVKITTQKHRPKSKLHTIKFY